MNKAKINELWKQAIKDVRSDEECEGVAFNDFEGELRNRFAELLVRECCDVLYDNEMGGYQVNYVLKEHFGVE